MCLMSKYVNRIYLYVMYCIFDNKWLKNTKKVLYFDIKCKNTKKTQKSNKCTKKQLLPVLLFFLF